MRNWPSRLLGSGSSLESPRNGSLSLQTLVKLAHALGKEVKVQFV